MRRGYEDDYRRGDSRIPPSRRVVDEPSSRDDRHRPERVEARERTRIVDEPRPDREIRPERERDNRPERSERTDRAERPDRNTMDYAMENQNRMGGTRADPRANAAARLDPPMERQTITAYRDPRTGELRDARTHELLDTSGRSSRPRDYDDRMDRDDPPPPTRRRERDPVDPRTARDDYDDFGNRGPPRTGYTMNEYFVESAGIEREVMQHDICRYLGNDATVRRYTKDNREGYLIRAYRALTTAQLEDLRRDSTQFRRSQDAGRRSGRNTGSYAEMRARDEQQYGDAMDVDDFEPTTRLREEPPPRAGSGRHVVAPVSSAYPPEPSFPAYALGSNQGPYGTDQMPRSAYPPGNTSPGGARPVQPQFPPSSYAGRTSGATMASIPTSQVYQDPKTGKLVTIGGGGYEGGFAPEPPRGGRGRHG